MKLKIRIIFVTSVIIALYPMIGIPGAWKSILAVILGLGIVVTTYLLHHELVRVNLINLGRPERITEAYREGGSIHEGK